MQVGRLTVNIEVDGEYISMFAGLFVAFAEAPFWKILKGLFTSRYLPGVERSPLKREVATKLKVDSELIFIVLVMRQEPQCYCDEHHLLLTPVPISHSLSRFII